MLTPEQIALLKNYLTIDGDGNVIGDDNVVNITKQTAGDYAVQIGQQRITFNIKELRQVLKIENSQVGVVGDNAHIEGGIHYTTTIYQNLSPQPVTPEALRAAQSWLDDLPLDHIPGIAALPPGSRMPFWPNPLFVGREADLLSLAQALKGGQTTAIGQIAAATGLGGIGKSQLATEFAHRYGQFFSGGVFWLSFAEAPAIPTEIAACGGGGGLNLHPDFAALSLAEQVRMVLGAWCNPLPRLLVFDAAAGAIAAELGDLPLALYLAGSFLAAYRHARFGQSQAYLSQLRCSGLEHPSLSVDGQTLTTAHARHVARSFALSYERLDPANPVDAVALALLARSAHFAPGEPIPRGLLLGTLDSEKSCQSCKSC